MKQTSDPTSAAPPPLRLFHASFFFFGARAKVPASVRKMLRTWRTHARTHAREHTLNEGGTRVFGWFWARCIEREKYCCINMRGGKKQKNFAYIHTFPGEWTFTLLTQMAKRGPRASSLAWPSVPREFASCKRLWRTGTLMEWRDLTRTADSRLI